ncbi:MAG: presqualene diphosphate synthase HpnD [Alphaproteobacteria bacterium]
MASSAAGTMHRTDASGEGSAEAHVSHVVAASGTSFYWAMRLLPPPRRAAMFAIYAFCREVDDIADDEAPVADKRVRLAAWREEIARLFHGRPEWPTGQALLEPMKTYGLAREDFLALIDGMEMDAAGMCAPTLEELELYCDRVASAVGRLSIKAFGAGEPRARDVARHLGQALQLTNILRDLTEDAQRGRLYLPEELLTRHGVRSRDPAGALTEPGIAAVCDELAAMARARFAEARRAVADCASAPMRPAVVMLEVYRRILDRLCARGWRDLDRPVRLSKLTKLWIGLRYGLG